VTGCHIRVRVLQSGEKRYDVRYRRGGRGFRVEHAGTFQNRRDANLRRDLVRGWLAAGKDPQSELRARETKQPERTFSQWAEQYRTSRVDLSDESRSNMRSHLLRANAVIGTKTVTDLSVGDIQDLVAALSAALKPASVHRYVKTVQLVLDYAGADPNVARDRRVKLPRVERAEKRLPTGAQIERMLERIPPRWRLPVRVLAATGARVGELERWAWGDLDQASGRILNRVGKTTAARRWVAIPTDLVDELAAACPPDDRVAGRPLFPGFSADVAKNAIARACRAAGVPHLSPHDLRHRYISIQLARGVPVANVGAQVGHSKLSETLDTYTHVVVDEQDVRHG
jgi:integrase